VFSKRTTLKRNIYDTVARRWKELGLPGQIPAVRAFEAETQVIYHEVGGFEPGLQPGESGTKIKGTARKPRKSSG
jgi:4-hydroxy-3-polyprenylbenzoate decarboxylase